MSAEVVRGQIRRQQKREGLFQYHPSSMLYIVRICHWLKFHKDSTATGKEKDQQ